MPGLSARTAARFGIHSRPRSSRPQKSKQCTIKPASGRPPPAGQGSNGGRWYRALSRSIVGGGGGGGGGGCGGGGGASGNGDPEGQCGGRGFGGTGGGDDGGMEGGGIGGSGGNGGGDGCGAVSVVKVADKKRSESLRSSTAPNTSVPPISCVMTMPLQGRRALSTDGAGASSLSSIVSCHGS